MPLLPGIPTLPSLKDQLTGLLGPPARGASLPNPPQRRKPARVSATQRPSPLEHARARLHHSGSRARSDTGNQLTDRRENSKGRGCESSPEPGSSVTPQPACPQYGAREGRRAWRLGGARMLAARTAPKLGRDLLPSGGSAGFTKYPGLRESTPSGATVPRKLQLFGLAGASGPSGGAPRDGETQAVRVS